MQRKWFTATQHQQGCSMFFLSGKHRQSSLLHNSFGRYACWFHVFRQTEQQIDIPYTDCLYRQVCVYFQVQIYRFLPLSARNTPKTCRLSWFLADMRMPDGRGKRREKHQHSKMVCSKIIWPKHSKISHFIEANCLFNEENCPFHRSERADLNSKSASFAFQ